MFSPTTQKTRKPKRKTINESQRDLMAARRQAQSDLVIPDPEDLDRRNQLAEDDAAWLKHYLPDAFGHPFTDDHLQTISECGQSLRYGLKRAKAAPRGDGKSTIVKYLALKYALNREVKFPLIVAATHTKAVRISKDIRAKLAAKGKTPLSADYPLECVVARRVDPWPSRARNVTANGARPINVEWGAEYFTLPVWADEETIGPIIMALGYSSDSLQGCNVADIRPDFVMLDDLDSRDSLSAEHGVVAEKIEECVDKTIAGLGGMSEGLGQYMLCTITSRRAAAYKYTDPAQKPAWGGHRVSAIVKWPDDMRAWDKYCDMRQRGMQKLDAKERPIDPYGREAHAFYLANREAMDAGAVLCNPHNFERDILPDGTQKQVSSLQRCFDFIADYSREAFDTEHQNDPPADDNKFEPKLSWLHVSDCASDYDQNMVDVGTSAIVRAVDVRKIELHDATVARSTASKYRIPDYGVRTHGTTETTVEQAEQLILEGLRKLRLEWAESPLIDSNGMVHEHDLVLVDKGWIGNWTEDGEVKTWATQPVETFCIEAGLDTFLPAKGAPNYQSPAPDRLVIIGDNWHINKGKGKNRKCDEVIWNADHFHLLVEELFLLSDDSDDRFDLFAPGEGIYTNHKAIGHHIAEGAKQLREQMARGSRSRKPRFVRDHWWDSLAMCLVGLSIVSYRVERQTRAKPRRTLAQMAGR